MKCLHPYQLPSGLYVGCGKCRNCANKYRNDWCFRLSYHAQKSDVVDWVLITYSDENLPKVPYFYAHLNSEHYPYFRQQYRPHYVNIDTPPYSVPEGIDLLLQSPRYNEAYYYDETIDMPILKKIPVNSPLVPPFNKDDINPYYTNLDYVQSVCKEDMQLFLNNVQHVLRRNYNAKMRYFYCAEYGNKKTDNLRPHYHCFFFISCYDEEKPYNSMQVRADLANIINEKWQKGFCSHDFAPDEGSVMYTTKYSMKEECPYPFGAVRPYVQMSKGLGASLLDLESSDRLNALSAYEKQLLEGVSTLAYTMKGTKMQLPRYYRKKLLANENDTQKEDRLAKVTTTQTHQINSQFLQVFQNYALAHPVINSPPHDTMMIIKYNMKVNTTYMNQFMSYYKNL